MTEIHFIVEEAVEGGFIARAVGSDIYTEANNRLHITREEVLAA